MEETLPHNPTFDNLDKEENAELRFFCEALSLVDSVNNSNLLLGFCTHVRESKNGGIKWDEIPDLHQGTETKSVTYTSTIEQVGSLVNEVVLRGWITPLRTRSLGALAQQAHTFHKHGSKDLAENGNARRNSNLSLAWKEVAVKLTKLADYQDQHMSYHTDFQKHNYLPHPDSWKVYLGTFVFIFITLLYSSLYV